MHCVHTEQFHSKLRPDWSSVRKPFPKIPNNVVVLSPQIGAVRYNLVHLGESFASSMLEVVLDVGKGLVNLVLQIRLDEVVEINLRFLSNPATYPASSIT
jgi:hypothetical protein